jgi:ribose 5-phosphate isomerase B
MAILNVPAEDSSVFSGKIFVGTDHAGFGLKEKLVPVLRGAGYEVMDMGAHEYEEGDDYPDFVIPVAREVSKRPEQTRGIILGATGEGEAIAANKFPHVRAVVFYGTGRCVVDDEADVIERSRQHNNSNILSLAARYLTEEDMLKAVKQWLATPFSKGERHLRRLAKIDNINI